ncbi:aldehyde-activating protein [Stenotrophomonas panacihumi]|uniref:Aldehyde-activating protein n=1 Tax=Stenotrophomonas panacihumi TaxID=676599 RepID=A0A0R0APZ8_9GAMM|nr:GFA family protein [Stenotrophomonas panacihumi]KRG42307.1 aldehyde-activating protein [Stenotrophomonas panacihumi]PTN53596.1 GFA family protein [Stenotrophomonas panacihumi]
MTTQTYHGSCHCGQVRYEVDLDPAKLSGGKCNCSICRKTRNWSTSVQPGAFRLLSGEGAVTDYQFGTMSMHWPFCSRCGVRSYGHGDIPEMGGAFYSVQLACLDDIDDALLAAAPVTTCDGKGNDWMHPASPDQQKFL